MRSAPWRRTIARSSRCVTHSVSTPTRSARPSGSRRPGSDLASPDVSRSCGRTFPMPDQTIDAMDPFETRLSQDLRSLSAVALRSVDAVEVARGLAAAGARRRSRLVPGFGLGLGLRRRLEFRPRTQGFVAGLAAAAVVVAV